MLENIHELQCSGEIISGKFPLKSSYFRQMSTKAQIIVFHT